MVKIRINKNYLGLLIIVFCFLPNLLSPVRAASVNPLDYVQLTPKLVTFSDNEIVGNETFDTLVSGRVTWVKSYPLFVLLASVTKEAKVTFSIEAQNKITGDWVVLNQAYSVYIKKPFPKRVGESYQAEEKITLQFPKTAESGDYDLTAKLLRAGAKFYFFGWTDVKNYFPQLGNLGSVKYTR